MKNIAHKLRILLVSALFVVSSLPISVRADSSYTEINSTFYIPGLSACGTVTASPSLGTGNSIFYIGDSLFFHMIKGSSDPAKYATASGLLLEKTQAAGYTVDTTIPAIGGTDSTDIGPRIIGKSVEAQGGVNVANSIKHIGEHTQDYATANIIVIGLGTNTEQLDFKTQIRALIDKIRETNSSAQIFWVNTYYTAPKQTTYTQVNQDIATVSANGGVYKVIDYASAAQKDPSIAPEPYVRGGADGVHVNTGEGRQKKADWLLSQLPKPGTSSTGTLTAGSNGSDAYVLTWPNFTDEPTLATKMTEFIQKKSPNSPYLSIPNFSQNLINEAKRVNTNPLLPLFIAVQESNLGVSPVASRNKNSFGNKGNPDTSGDGYREWPDFASSFYGSDDSFTAGIPRRLANSPNYKDVETIGDYLSVHVSGRIIKPGDPTQVFDPIMNEYVDFSDVQTYINNVHGWISEITGQAGPGSGTVGGCTKPGGVLPAGEGGYDLPNDGGLNPMVYYSQLSSGSSKFVQGYFGTKTYGTGTIEECGCGPTSMSMIVSTLTTNKIDPEQMAKWASDNGYQNPNCGSSWFWTDQKTQETYGITANLLSGPSQIANSLQSGKLVIASVSSFPLPGMPAGHITVIRKFKDGKFFFADSFSEGWRSVDDVSVRAYNDFELASIINQAWEISAQ